MRPSVVLALRDVRVQSSVRGFCAEKFSVVIEMAGSKSVHALVSAGEGMATLTRALAFLAVAALAMVTELTLVKGLQRRNLVQRKRF
jgi:hypothetical protein